MQELSTASVLLADSQTADCALKANILLVDDSPTKLLALESALASLGQNLLTARSAAEALRYLLAQDCAVIVLDVNMPGMNGFELAEVIRRRERSQHTPIIFISAISPTETHAFKGYELGAVDYIYTPTPEVLRAKVAVFADLFKKTAEAKRYADALRLLNAQLEQRVAERTTALEALNAALEQQVAERTALLALLQTVTAAANEAVSLEAALQLALERICAYTGWPVGHIYLPAPDNSGLWASSTIWHLDPPARFVAFQQATQAMQYTAGEGTIGRVVASGQPEWGVDVVTDMVLARRDSARGAWLSTGFAFPMLVDREVVGVCEFYTDTRQEPDPALCDALMQIGIQLGRVVERQRTATQLQRQQEALSQHEKLAALGSLLASVAHELNNPLAVVMMHADLLREDLGSAPLLECVEEIAQAAERCRRLVRNFLTLARQHPPERAAVSLNTLIAETVEMLAYALQIDNITVHLCLAENLPPLWADPYQLQQVLTNLLTNAHQALRESAVARQLTLATRCNPARTRLTLEVTDTGPGIPPGLQERIFEPFFTTKPLGLGTGLGLPLCRGIVEGHGGTISVTSQAGQGTTFRVELPVEAVPGTAPAAPGLDSQPAVYGKAILIIDDEPSIAQGLRSLLRRDGYVVETVANGRLALAKLQERTYDLLVSDLRMPELDGPSLYQTLQRQYPHLLQRVIFLTGDTLNPETRLFLEQSAAPCLTKPCTVAELRHAIQQALQAV